MSRILNMESLRMAIDTDDEEALRDAKERIVNAISALTHKAVANSATGGNESQMHESTRRHFMRESRRYKNKALLG